MSDFSNNPDALVKHNKANCALDIVLARSVDWKILSHCDGRAVKNHVEYGHLKAEPIVSLQSDRTFMKKCNNATSNALKPTKIWKENSKRNEQPS